MNNYEILIKAETFAMTENKKKNECYNWIFVNEKLTI
ncbi:MAG: hypothetical protein K0R54_769 [Clostridiaceae bacterium]|jgi:hypothetical protein|nr:hypothetical protein [Clostridiaceae bacterium]